jgi:hypothetical protein
VVVRTPAGADDLLLLEAGPPDLGIALALLAAVVRDLQGARIDPASLPISDVDLLLLRLRQRVLGDVVSAEEHCPAPGCHARVDITFSIGAYLDHHVPTEPVGVGGGAESGWYRLADQGVEFRVPCAADQLAIARAAEPELALLQRCVRAAQLDEPARQRVEEAMEAISPSLCGDLEGTCPACGVSVSAVFDPLDYTMRELRAQAAFVYDDVCAIAHYFHWSEAEILALPAARRARYAELAAQKVAREGTSA